MLQGCQRVVYEEEGYRVVAGINGDFYNVGNGLPIGIVVMDGELRSSDAKRRDLPLLV